MKKALAILLIPIFLLTAAFGVTVTVYSCNGMNKGTEKVAMSKPCCKDVGKKGCCNKESKILKIKDDFVKTVNQVGISKLLVLEFNLIHPLYIIHYKVSSLSMYRDIAPPKDVSRYILFHSLII
jgi:hypothetical protein